MNYWLHRITGGQFALEYAQRLLESGYLSIGWSDFSCQEDLDQIIRDNSTDRLMAEAGWGAPRNRWNLWRFVCAMKKGDKVVVPMPYYFAVYEIIDNEILCNETIDPCLFRASNGTLAELYDRHFHNSNGNEIDLGFYRRVIKLHPGLIPRSEYADQHLISWMKFRSTNADITSIRSSVEDALMNYDKKRPINIKNEIMDKVYQHVVDTINKYSDDSRFEELVGWYLRRLGAHVHTPSKSESPTEQGDADRVAYFETLKTIIMVQVKKYCGTTGDWAVQQIKAYKENHLYNDGYHTQLWVISASEDFSENAIRMAADNDVRLINGEEFAKMVLDIGLLELNI